MDWKPLVGIALCIGFGCRALGIPAPAPPLLVGALLVMAMTLGYLLADNFLARRSPRHAAGSGITRDSGGSKT